MCIYMHLLNVAFRAGVLVKIPCQPHGYMAPVKVSFLKKTQVLRGHVE